MQEATLPRRVVRALTRLVVGAILIGLLGVRGWQRWGPVPERQVPEQLLVRQWSSTTCGPAAVATLLNAYGRSWTDAELERECRVGPEGSSLYDLPEALRLHGLRADALEARTPEALLRVPRPFIAHLVRGHFVVVLTFRGGRFDVFDPTSGDRWSRSPRELHAAGRGTVLAVSATTPK